MYLDYQADFSQRLISGGNVRAGLTAEGYPFPAPTGVADFSLRLPSSSDQPDQSAHRRQGVRDSGSAHQQDRGRSDRNVSKKLACARTSRPTSGWGGCSGSSRAPMFQAVPYCRVFSRTRRRCARARLHIPSQNLKLGVHVYFSGAVAPRPATARFASKIASAASLPAFFAFSSNF